MFKDNKSSLRSFVFLCALGYGNISLAGGGEQCEGNTGDPCSNEGMMQGHFLPTQGSMAYSDDGLAYKPFFGPALSTRVRLQEHERPSVRGASFGQWRSS